MDRRVYTIGIMYIDAYMVPRSIFYNPLTSLAEDLKIGCMIHVATTSKPHTEAKVSENRELRSHRALHQFGRHIGQTQFPESDNSTTNRY